MGDASSTAQAPQADPRDMSDKYNTKLDAKDEFAYQLWALQNKRTGDTYDYDMRGAWKAGIGASDNGHFPDTFKKPNHPTFSDQSQFHGKEGNVGGSWSKDGDQDVFTASKTNLKNMSEDEMRSYFRKVEPKARLIIK